LVMWTVLFSNLLGYAVGSLQRIVNGRRYTIPIRAYMAV